MREISLTFLLLFQQIADTRQKHLHIEWLGDIGIGSRLIASRPALICAPCREQDDRDMRGLYVLLDAAAHIRAVHPWHHHITHDDVRIFSFSHHRAFYSIFRRQHLIIYTAQFLGEEVREVFIILHHQHSLLYLPESLYPHGTIHHISHHWRCDAVLLRSLLLHFTLQVGRNIHDKTGTLTLLAFQRNLTFVQLDVFIYHIQSDTRTYLLRARILLRAIESLEHMRLVFLRNAAARIFHYDMGASSAIQDAFLQTNTHTAPCLRKLEGIGEKIGQYLAHLILVEIHKQSLGLVFERQADVLLLSQRHELHRGILDKLIQISTRQVQSFSIHLHLAEVEKLVYQLQQVARIPAYIVQLMAGLAIRGTLQDASYRRDDEREQGAELVADIGEEAILHLLQLLILLILHALAVLLNLPPYNEDYQGDEYQEIQELGPPSSPKWSQHLYLQGCRLLAPYLV